MTAPTCQVCKATLVRGICPGSIGLATVNARRRHDERRLGAFVADACARFPLAEIVLFGSRARGDAGPRSDWDIAVRLADDATEAEARSLLADQGLRRHFHPYFLDLWVLGPDGTWHYWVPDAPQHRSWEPDPAFLANIRRSSELVWPGEAR